MVYDKKFKANPKKKFPLAFFVLLFGTVVGIFVLQSVLGVRRARVSFSHQLEHLVNLNLIVQEDSRKVSLNDNLVTFSGRFKSEELDDSKNRFQYLDYLRENHLLKAELQDLSRETMALKAAVVDASVWFLSVSGESLPANGFVIFDESFDVPTQHNSITIADNVLVQFINFDALRTYYNRLSQDRASTLDDWKKFGNDVSVLIGKYKSPILGISQESLKLSLSIISKDIEDALASNGSIESFRQIFGSIFVILERINSSLNSFREGIRLSELRAVRLYKDELIKQQKLLSSLAINEQHLDKYRAFVVNSVWFFNNKELSTRALEKQDPEEFNHWFNGASAEWLNFEGNKSLFFKAPDQPRNVVLEKTFQSEVQAPNYFGYIITFMPAILIIGLLYFVFSKQAKGVGGGAMGFGKSPARLLQQGLHRVTFEDVAGIDEAKEELIEIIDFLRDPSKFTALGGRIPKGVLLIGPPGTGKTLVAKAVAGEADRPFFSIAGSDFVEMFVGVGASRIRDMFEQAKKNAPCIIFIDEIDAVGRHRGAGVGGGHDEREQTLNQLLVEMDGFDTNEGVILMAATNRPDVLDKALLRPGRFDRRVIISLPDIKGRTEILKVHAKKITIDPTVDLSAIAKGTPGASGADLENLLNESALFAARQNRSAVTAVEVAYARDKVLYGKERRSLEMDAHEKLTTAYHESGHTVVSLCVKHSDPVDKVTIIPRGLSLGATHFLPEKNRLSYWKKELYDRIAVLMGGRIAEEIFVNDMSSGAQQDIVHATKLARSMVCEWGMSEVLGTVAYDEHSEGGQFGYGAYSAKTYSDETAKLIDNEIKSILYTAYNTAKSIIESHKEELELMTKMLVEFETLDSADVKDIINHSWDADKKRKKMLEEDLSFKKNDLVPPPPPDEVSIPKLETNSN